MGPRYSLHGTGLVAWFWSFPAWEFDVMGESRPANARGQLVKPDVDDRGRIEREQLAEQQAADDADAQGMAQFRTSTAAQSQRQAAEQGRHGGHHDRAEAQEAGLVDSFLGGLVLGTLGLQRKVDHHNRV